METEATPLAGVMNETFSIFGKPTSVREVLKWNKVDVSLIDWMARSPTAYDGLKGLYTYVSRKKKTKHETVTSTDGEPSIAIQAMSSSTSPEYPSISGLSHQMYIQQQGPDKSFVEEDGVSLNFSGSGSSKRKGVMEVNNRVPRSVIQREVAFIPSEDSCRGSCKLQNLFSIHKLSKSIETIEPRPMTGSVITR
ncbi:hypothetical protein MMC31_004569 [Peltigera leucophlebia]|nr:hypothetical protein [Peltigera leucophlebia]